MRKKLLLATTIGFTYATLNAQTTMQVPRAKKIDKKLTIHNDTRIDSYFWLNDRENKEVIAYLEEENKYTKAIMQPTEALQKQLFTEMRARIKEDDSSVPYKLNGYWYETKFEKNKEYPLFYRYKESLKTQPELLFDVNEMAKNHAYYQLGGLNVSPNNKLVAFGVDQVSRRIYTIQIKDLSTGKILSDKIENTTASSVWAADNKTLFYTRKDKSLRAYQIWKHVLGTSSKEDILVYEEKDDTFSTYVYKSKSREYIIIGSSSTMTDEYRYIKADEPNAEFRVFQPRERGLEYSIEHFGNNFYVQTNKDGAQNFKIMKTPTQSTTQDNWVEFIPHREDILVEGFEIFRDYLVIQERKNGLLNLNIRSWDGANNYYLPFDETTYTASTSVNPDFDTNILRYNYTSLTTPSSVIDYDMKNKTFEVKKEQKVLGNFDKSNYVSERIWTKARDGKMVPVSIVRRKDTPLSAQTPLLLYAYGSYGYSMEPYFSTTRLSLLDRGFIFAIAHIRGGEEMGRSWYEDGKLLNKKNTFYDFIDVAKDLVAKNYTSTQHLYAMGGSAGGLLMGAVINLEPNLFHGVIAQVPFVDVVTTMLDDTIPLTTGEYDEWGNPNDEIYYQYIKSYSPYDNIEKKSYPHLLVTTGLHDSQVQYWEPAKWVAKLREYKTDNNLLLLDTNMDTGHGGASGRFESLKEVAFEYAFLLMLENKLK
ncbi:S9 family peptidase [Weeksella virosa]|uniref:Proline-specific endopeptidase n=1 Tax=Weeksella virosa (strain ATCC 43766 / DSM 16922 / JCM 21250 / CCUG 30538 / CDC 9751 / IAM 14551 / NBRC 16016 / NCTC 11634 / CL345/78) TaxID=865938 RepID=F0NZK1_WEEVC|nr:Oligopeptidase B [Weeksella virosa DSM 16922]VEH64009.1 Protease 2 [Weeksella virosa]